MKLRVLGFGLLFAALSGAHADAEHDRISTDRAAANAKLVERERDCTTRFIVATCVEEARAEYREGLKKLRQQELQLDEGRRRVAADARRKAIADKAQAQQARASDAAAEEPSIRVRRAMPAPVAATSRADHGLALHPPGAGGSRADRDAAAQRSQQAFEARQRQARSHRDAVARRNAERAAEGKMAAPLPPVDAQASR
jgi:hypothetical protein